MSHSDSEGSAAAGAARADDDGSDPLPGAADDAHELGDASGGAEEVEKEQTGDGDANADNNGLNDDENDNDDDDNDDDEGVHGLFGSGSEDEGEEGDGTAEPDEAGGDGEEEDEEEEEGASKKVLEVSLGRHAVPESTDGEIYTIKMPSFLAVEPAAFTPQSFTLPETYHHSSAPPPSAAAFSPLAVATTTLRWRYAPDGSGVLQSDARILQWSDGSLTLQLASNAPAQFELAPKPLAPRLYSNKRGPRQQHGGGGRAVEPGAYAEQHDAHTYVTAPHESAHLLRVTNHVTASLSVLPSEQVDDAALTQLRASLAAARERRNNKHHQLAAQTKGQTAGGAGGAGGVGVGGAPNGSVGDGPPIITVTEDPELAKRRAEIAEKERLRQQRRMQMSMARELERSNRTLSKSGLSRTGGSAGAGGMLSVSGLEEDEATDRARRQQRGSGMAAAAAVASARKKQARGRYDDDDDLPRYRSREDEYDRTDDFLAPSDEEDDDFEGDTDDDDDEEEVLGDEDGTDDADDDEEDRAAARKKSRKKDKKKKGKDRAKPREKRLDAKDKGATTPSPPRPPTSPNTNKRERPGDDDNVDGSGRKASQQTDAVQPSSAKDARLKRRRLIVEDDEE